MLSSTGVESTERKGEGVFRNNKFTVFCFCIGKYPVYPVSYGKKILRYCDLLQYINSAGVTQVDSQEPLGRITKSLQHVPFLITV